MIDPNEEDYPRVWRVKDHNGNETQELLCQCCGDTFDPQPGEGDGAYCMDCALEMIELEDAYERQEAEDDDDYAE